jgi:hypothetical protein
MCSKRLASYIAKHRVRRAKRSIFALAISISDWKEERLDDFLIFGINVFLSKHPVKSLALYMP